MQDMVSQVRANWVLFRTGSVFKVCLCRCRCDWEQLCIVRTNSLYSKIFIMEHDNQSLIVTFTVTYVSLSLSFSQVMSTITSQPLLYGLEREKHIEMLFRAFHQKRRSSINPQDLTTTSHPTQGPLYGDLSLTLQATGLESNRHKGEQWVRETLPPALATLRTVSQIHITAITEFQGKTCGPNLKTIINYSLLGV